MTCNEYEKRHHKMTIFLTRYDEQELKMTSVLLLLKFHIYIYIRAYPYDVNEKKKNNRST